MSQFTVPGLATVTIDESGYEPIVSIVLDPSYMGDLRPLERGNRLPENVLIRCDAVTCRDTPELQRFIEVLHHWDHNGDGVYDADHIVQAIDDALWRTDDAPVPFRRPNEGWYVNLLMRLMPPQPERHIVMGYADLRERFQMWHYLIAVPTILVIIGLIELQVQLVPFMQYSVVSGAIAVMNTLGIPAWLGAVILIAIVILASFIGNDRVPSMPSHSPHTFGFFNKAAVYEEQAFREGSERWSFTQRTMSCFVFGAIHMMNLIYPLATILPLALGGAVFMTVYLRSLRAHGVRRRAVLDAAIVHRVYNRLALFAIGAWLVYALGLIGAVLLGIAGMYWAFGDRHPTEQKNGVKYVALPLRRS